MKGTESLLGTALFFASFHHSNLIKMAVRQRSDFASPDEIQNIKELCDLHLAGKKRKRCPVMYRNKLMQYRRNQRRRERERNERIGRIQGLHARNRLCSCVFIFNE